VAKFFEISHGLGLWEMFVSWLYGDVHKAPAVNWEAVQDSADAANAVQFSSGAVAVAALVRADRREVFPLALIDETGAVLEPTPTNIAAGRYPLVRPAYIVFGERPVGSKRKVLEFLLSEQGQALVAASDLLPLTAIPAPPP
jgi:phosphate transport system substrate-binding protein